MELQPSAMDPATLAAILFNLTNADEFSCDVAPGCDRRDTRGRSNTASEQGQLVHARATDEQLVCAAKSSDARAFEELSRRYLPTIRKKVFRILRNREDAEDVVQESLMNAYSHLASFRESCAFPTWISRIATNSALMLLRKRRVRAEVSIDQPVETDDGAKLRDTLHHALSSERTYATRQALGVLTKAINGLPSEYRSVLDLFHLQEKSLQEAADTLGLSIGSVKSRLFRARRILRSRLEARGVSVFDACY
ncbi:RNA polymerase sigma factor [Occallatibacter riparius]|uniref:RNA polymerase sigma factor n=1 Tax=Occallatibacter riparius TaxID=1002689 RepID=A0A9J7BQP6_9BACT|nr:sigma-70 family RNA polymerase sigma factor [Occallatibacter riparius]UWZ85196.1 sigma-70 family RNA polymerase sigma factor [Occallatibacter riparius]